MAQGRDLGPFHRRGVAAHRVSVGSVRLEPDPSTLAIRRGVLFVAVDHAPLLSELAGYYRQAILDKLSSQHGDLKIRDLKFKLDSGIAARNAARAARSGADD